MIRFAILILVLLNGTAMAYDSNTSVDTPLRPPTRTEQFDASPRGQELQTVVDMMLKRDPDANAAYEAYRQKYNTQPRSALRPKQWNMPGGVNQ